MSTTKWCCRVSVITGGSFVGSYHVLIAATPLFSVLFFRPGLSRHIMKVDTAIIPALVDVIRDEVLSHINAIPNPKEGVPNYSAPLRLSSLAACSLVHSFWRHKSQKFLFSSIWASSFVEDKRKALKRALDEDGDGGRLRGYVKTARWIDGGIDEELFRYFDKLQSLECEFGAVSQILSRNDQCSYIIAGLRELVLFEGVVGDETPSTLLRLTSLEHLIIPYHNDIIKPPFLHWLPISSRSTITALTIHSGKDDWPTVIPLVGRTLRWLCIGVAAATFDEASQVQAWSQAMSSLEVLENITLLLDFLFWLGGFEDYCRELPPSLKSISLLLNEIWEDDELENIREEAESCAALFAKEEKFPNLVKVTTSPEIPFHNGFRSVLEGNPRISFAVENGYPNYFLGMYPIQT